MSASTVAAPAGVRARRPRRCPARGDARRAPSPSAAAPRAAREARRRSAPPHRGVSARAAEGHAGGRRRGGTASASSSSSSSSLEPSPELLNADLAPLPPDKRSFTSYDMVALWIGLVVCVPAWTLCAGLLELGLSISWSVLVLFAGSCLLLPALLLNAHAGTKYGVPFPVLARQAFGVRGANVVSLLRGLVAAGWFGIQTWFGGEAIHTIGESSGALAAAFGGAPLMREEMAAWWAAGLRPTQLLTFAMFWALQAGIIWRGMDLIRVVEGVAAPILILLCLLLFGWAMGAAGGVAAAAGSGAVASGGGAPAAAIVVPALTGVAGFWASLVLNISDFSRYSKSQRGQLVGQVRRAAPPRRSMDSRADPLTLSSARPPLPARRCRPSACRSRWPPSASWPSW